MTEAKVIQNPSLIFFSMGVAGLLAWSLPSNREMGKLHLGSYQPEMGEAFLQAAVNRDPKNPEAIRGLADAMENQGRIQETLGLVKKLVALRPKNLEYREREIRVLNWLGKRYEATRAKERLVFLQDPPSYDSLEELSDDYLWLQASEDYLRIQKHLWKAGVRKDYPVENAIRGFFKLGKFEAARALAEKSVEEGWGKKGVFLTLFYAFIDIQDPESAMTMAARYVGDSMWEGWKDTRYLEKLSASDYEKQSAFLKDVMWVYLEQGREPQAFFLMEKLRVSDAMDRSLLTPYLDALFRLKGTPEIKAKLAVLARKFPFDTEQWRNVAKRFLWKKDSTTSAAILESLIEERNPLLILESDESSFVLPEAKRSLLASLDHRVLVGLMAEWEGKTSGPGNLSNTKQLEIYRDLLEVYDSDGQVDKSISLLEKIRTSAQSGRLKLTAKEENEFWEKLLERYSWNSNSDKVIELVESSPSRGLSVRSRVIYGVALGGSNVERQGEVLSSLTEEEISTLDADLRLLVTEYRDSKKDEAEERRLASELGTGEIIFRQSALSDIENRPSFKVGTGYLHTGDMENLMLDVQGDPNFHIGSYRSRVRGGVSHLLRTSESLSHLAIGLRRRQGELNYSGELGFLFNQRYFVPQSKLEVSGDFGMFPFASLSLSLAKPIPDSQGLAASAVSETRLEFYYEKFLSSWVEARGNLLLRLSHVGSTLAEGQGIESSHRIYLGRREWRLRGGPWVQYLRWGTQNLVLRNLLVGQLSVFGGFAHWDWGGESRRSWKGYATAGYGVNFSGQGSDRDSIFFESAVEKLLWKDGGIKLEYALYTNGFNQNTNASTQMGVLSLIQEL